MCGILVNFGKEELTPEHPALEIISHRGPDGRGAVSFDVNGLKLGFGHRRLSIIDLSEKGSQPMTLGNGDFWITYNGEIYNYIEIRNELSGKGYTFRSETDTEVLLAAYAEWGRKCLDRLNGMFAFCIYDRTKNVLFAARDRLGIKPMYYTNTPRAFRIASEIKQFTQFDDFSAEADRERLYHFLNTGDFAYDEGTLWKGVNELEPGHCVLLNLDSWIPGRDFRKERWYAPPFFEENTDISFEDAVSEFRSKINKAVKLRLRADVPLGFLLSGGLDSSTLVGMAHQAGGAETPGLKTYSSCYDDKSIDERKYINAVLERTKSDSCLHFPKPGDLTENLDRVISSNDVPVLHGSPVPHWLIYRHIKNEQDNRKVILEGQGSDEILCGYGDFFWAFFYETLCKGQLAKLTSEIVNFQKLQRENPKIFIRKFLRLAFPDRVKFPSNPVLNTEFLLGGRHAPPQPVRREQSGIPQLHRSRLTILRYILHNVDRNSMSQSRETRVPFLDHNLVEFCLKLPSEYKIHNGWTKRVLRESVKDILPEAIYRRHDKQGYSSPVKNWASGELKSFFMENLRESSGLPFLKKETILNGFREFAGTKGWFDPVWWRVAVTGRWIKIFKIKL